MSSGKIRILVVEDSAVARELLIHILSADPELEVVGTANDGEEAIAMLGDKKPDVITMDVNMPRMDGFQATRQIMETQPLPIVIVTASCNPRDVATSFRALEAGAVAIIDKPKGTGHPDYIQTSRTLVSTVKAMSEVRVVRRWARSRQVAQAPEEETPRSSSAVTVGAKDVALVAIGVSTGGPPALFKILAGLPKDFPVPVLIVQHITEGFVQGLVDWLSQTTGFPVHLASHNEPALPGHVYIAGDGCHMGVDRRGRIVLYNGAPESGLRPAVSYLFRTIAENLGARAIGVLLTGMGKDGAVELKLMRERGAVTIAQDQESSVVFGMPGEAVRIGAATHVLPPEGIANLLRTLVKK